MQSISKSTVLYSQVRPLKKGGLFQISKIDGNCVEKEEAVESAMEEYNTPWFMHVGRKDLNTPILRKELPETKEFEDVEYVIQEKDTLRFATQTEISKLRGLPFNAEIGKSIQNNSYGRLVMAYQRARSKSESLLQLYKEIFEFNVKDGLITVKINNKPDKFYTSYYWVTIKDEYKNLPLKKILEVLQVYNISNINDEKDIPLLVNISLARMPYQFLLSRNPAKIKKEELNQVIISTLADNDLFIAHSYTFLLGIGSTPIAIHRNKLGIKAQNKSPIKEIDKQNILKYDSCTEKTRNLLMKNPKASNGEVLGTLKAPKEINNNWSNALNPEEQKELADFLIKCLANGLGFHPEEPDVWQKLDSTAIVQIVQLIAVTQIAECNHGSDYNSTRTPGMNKLARLILRQIAEGTNTFQEGFNIIQSQSNKVYIPIGVDGSIRARDTVRDVKRWHYKVENEKINCHSVVCYDMSSDSDDSY